jgi:hypothetical protein
MDDSDVSAPLSHPRPSDALRREPGYWTIAELAAHLQVSRWTAQRRVKADPSFPVLRGWGSDRFPIDRVKAYLQRLEQGRGRAYKSRGLLHLTPQAGDSPRVRGSEPGA